ncbi:MAG: single-stranded DNA-binding protein [Rhodocyclaceae bacterium]|nr:single-stranded DNA-binding protein [Rhodocyclaceae bacterium]
MNKVILLGNVGSSPEARSLPSGQAVTTLSLATNRKYKSSSGEPKKETEWHKLVCYGKTAEIAAQYLNKGSQVLVEGRLKTSSWEDKQTGQKRYKTEIVVDTLEFVGGRGSGAGRSEETSDFAGSSDSTAGGFAEDPSDDDIPF